MPVEAPHEIKVLCRDLLAEDSHLDETISIVGELEDRLTHWRAALERDLEAEREAERRQLRRAVRRLA